MHASQCTVIYKFTFSSHADLEALLEPTILALVPVMLVDGAVATAATCVCEVTADRSLEEALASLASELSIVLAARLVTTNDAFHARLLAAITATATCISSII